MVIRGTNWLKSVGFGVVAFIGFCYLLAGQLSSRDVGELQVDHGKLGAVASESKLCTQVGIDLLKAGGNAADAAVGTTFCVGVVNMYHSGIGGGGIALVRDSQGAYKSIDFREIAPAAADVDMFKDNIEASVLGGLASCVPGQVWGLHYIHSHYGLLPWSKVLQPAVDIARTGFRVNEDLVEAMGIPDTHDRRRHPFDDGDNSFLTEDPIWAADFAPNGTRLGLGDLMTRKRYANTLEKIAKFGIRAFYKGEIASQIVTAVQKANGLMTKDDLADYTVAVRSPVEISFHGYRLRASGVPASGAVTLSILKTLEGYGNFTASESVNLSTHRMVEAMRFGYGKRASFGDPDYLDDFHGFEASILNESYAAAIRSKILDSTTQNISAYDPNGFEMHPSHGTSHIATIDSSGLAISLTTTINLFFGSHLMIPENGIILNNQMNDFSIPNVSNVFGYAPSPANYIRPGKRPLSSMSPVIAESEPLGHSSSSERQKSTIMILGSAGGPRIITAVVQNALHTLLHSLSPYEAVAAPRLHDQLIPDLTSFELTYNNATVESMREKGHEVQWMPLGSSSAHIVQKHEDGSFEAVAEVRQMNSGGMVC
ncbi:MAG: hypothetical protein Q9195_005445 [Heterodermia aff. obscurata]